MVSGLHAHILVGIWKSRKRKWKQKWKTDMETCTVVSNPLDWIRAHPNYLF